MTPPSFNPPAVIGHRGAAGLAPENTIAAIRAAAAAGARWVELDIALTRDGIPVLLHDATLERTTDGEGALADCDFADLARLDAGSWFAPRFLGQRVPSLTEAIDELGRCGLGANLEIKTAPGRAAATADALVAALHRHWPAHLPPPLVSSFERAALAALRQADSELLLGYLAEDLGAGWQDSVRQLGCASLHLAHAKLAPEAFAAAKQCGLPLLLYTVNDPEEARRLHGAGAAAVFTDRPDRVAIA
ncbi:MAG: glycerophosphodiester phosphodiesterase [Alphaproteobacteria bacterium]|nr:glycerophosphodiester phosphodiesterase [Alphaproteobacteria bacterium]